MSFIIFYIYLLLINFSNYRTLVFPNINTKLIFDENDTAIYIRLFISNLYRLFFDNNTSIKKKVISRD